MKMSRPTFSVVTTSPSPTRNICLNWLRRKICLFVNNIMANTLPCCLSPFYYTTVSWRKFCVCTWYQSDIDHPGSCCRARGWRVYRVHRQHNGPHGHLILCRSVACQILSDDDDWYQLHIAQCCPIGLLWLWRFTMNELDWATCLPLTSQSMTSPVNTEHTVFTCSA